MPLNNRRALLYAIVDQAWLSLINLAVSISFIWHSTKSEYATYILLLTPLLLVQGIQNAVINSPMMTFLPSAAEDQKANILGAVTAMNTYFAIGSGLIGIIGLMGWTLFIKSDVNNFLLFGFGFAIVGVVARESQRSIAYASGHSLLALKGDVIFGLFMFLGITISIASAKYSAALLLTITGIAGVAPVALKCKNRNWLKLDEKLLFHFWSFARWALPAVFLTWVNLNAYSFFVGDSLGLDDVANIGAARLLLMPIGLATTAWSNFYRPKISAWLTAHNVPAVIQTTHTSLVIALLLLVGIALVLAVAYPILELLLGAKYQGLKYLTFYWLIFFSLTTVRNIFMATLMANEEGYRTLHYMNWFAMALSLPSFLLFTQHGIIWVMTILCAVELFQVIVVITKTRQQWKRVTEKAGSQVPASLK